MKEKEDDRKINMDLNTLINDAETFEKKAMQEQREQKKLKKAIKHLLNVPCGRFFMSYLLRETSVLEPISLGMSEKYLYALLGKRDMGLLFLNLLPQEYVGELLKEKGDKEI